MIITKCLETFSDNISIKYMPIVQQEGEPAEIRGWEAFLLIFCLALAQNILLCVGYLHRLSPRAAEECARSSQFMKAVSNRLGASVTRARFLGMIVGAAVSKLVDQQGKVMSFDTKEMETAEARAWLAIPDTTDTVGRLADLRAVERPETDVSTSLLPAKSSTPLSDTTTTSTTTKSSHQNGRIHRPKVQVIESDEDDLVAYPKPDEDPSDSEDDATLIDRTKPAAPVYILDLIKGLQRSDKPEVIHLMLNAAPSLIRRKTNFGTELSDHLYELATALVNLREDNLEDDFHSLRLESLIGCLVASPVKMGPWATNIYFNADFSISQRAALLSSIGLGVRELAGYRDDPKLDQKSNFPSQRLPGQLEAIYAPISNITKQIEHTTLQPMALEAADKLSGPDAIKIRTFSSRMQVQHKSMQKAKERQTRIPKHFHQILTQSIFIPLVSTMTMLLSSNATSIQNSTILHPHLVKVFLQTLTICLSCLGPHALQLRDATREIFTLLLTLHSMTTLSLDAAILPALLQLLLTTLDLNIESGPVGEEHLVTDFGNQIAELVVWASKIGDNVSVPVDDTDRNMPWPIIAAGCQVKWQEVGRKFQGRMLGLLGGMDVESF